MALHAITFDTLKFAETLKMSGLTDKQIVALVKAQQESFSDLFAHSVATKGDIVDLRAELKGDMVELRAELKGDMVELRAELKGDMVELRAEFKGDMSELKVDLIKWMVGLSFAQMALLGGIVIRAVM